MKMPMKWHEQCLENRKRHVEYLDKQRQKADADYWRSLGEMTRLESQIAEAKRQGKDGFDSDKFFLKKSRRD